MQWGMDNDDTFGSEPVLLRLDDPAELMAYLPYRLGFWPTESAVLFSLRGDRGTGWRPGLVARVDLADVGDDRRAAGLRAELIEHLRTDGATLTFLVLYTGQPIDEVRAGTGASGRTLAWWLSCGPGADPTRVWLVSAQRYLCLECREAPCCPDEGHPLDRLAETRIGAEMVFHGMAYAASREELLHVPAVDPQIRAAAVRAAARLRRRRVVAGRQRQVWLAELSQRWQHALDPASPAPSTPAECAALIVGLEEVAVRDAVLLAAATGVRLARARSSAGHALLDRVFSPDGPKPDRERLQHATDLVLPLTALAARRRTAPVWAVLGWLAWFEGNGARADLCLANCTAVDPEYRLALLVRRAVEHGIPPGWARASTAA